MEYLVLHNSVSAVDGVSGVLVFIDNHPSVHPVPTVLLLLTVDVD